ncbi:hypothetical protein PoB_002484100 [Plakobranchus ocellatus]|uniref:Uncharacterized protein n=1 Tax=Plakobranchus ocellatus TaxID=259542 RepID=A0AAV3ZUZ8_9GAST|nr:hypothetical protein PoB_002484100 [Plakobranchus ocellatus]
MTGADVAAAAARMLVSASTEAIMFDGTAAGTLTRGNSRSRSSVVQTYERGRGLREQRSGNPAGPGRERRRYGDDGPGSELAHSRGWTQPIPASH